MAQIIIPTPLRKYTEEQAVFTTDQPTVELAINELVNKFPALKTQVIDNSGKLRSFIKVFIGEEDIRGLGGEQATIGDKDVVSLIPAIAGGVSVSLN
ncbi:MAG: MoaD/ThiS family protein [Chitinophagales bacterium]|nr:MoaD/ThiS family protein [Chitinophagales bacterium]